MITHRALFFVALSLLALAPDAESQDRPRARDLGMTVGVLAPGPLNAITDVEGVLVGQVTVTEGDRVNTGVTAILPHGGSLYHDRVPAAMYVGNGFGKLLGVTQVRELGELETPVLLTCTLCVWKAADAMVEWALEQPGMERVGSLNAVLSANVRETRSGQRIRVGRRQRNGTCWDCEREWKRMGSPLDRGRPSEARQILRTRR